MYIAINACLNCPFSLFQKVYSKPCRGSGARSVCVHFKSRKSSSGTPINAISNTSAPGTNHNGTVLGVARPLLATYRQGRALRVPGV